VHYTVSRGVAEHLKVKEFEQAPVNCNWV